MVRIFQSYSGLLSGLSISYDRPRPYFITLTSGSSRTFACASTTSPRTHSYVPVAAYYASLVRSPLMTPLNTPTPSAISTPITGYYSNPLEKSSKLSTPAVAGIGIGAGLATSGAIAAIAICFWRKRKRGRASPTAGGAGPHPSPTNNTSQGYQSAT